MPGPAKNGPQKDQKGEKRKRTRQQTELGTQNLPGPAKNGSRKDQKVKKRKRTRERQS